MKIKVLMADPPEGWLHGFPKPFPGGLSMTPNERVKWFLFNGYPRELIDQGMLRYVRYYEQEIEVEDE